MNYVGGRLDLRKLFYFNVFILEKERQTDRQTERERGRDPQ